MANKTADNALISAAEAVGRTLGRAARGLDRIKKVGKAVVSGPSSRKPMKTAKKKAPAKPPASRKSRKEATTAALKERHAAVVDERALTRASAGRRWAARNKPH